MLMEDELKDIVLLIFANKQDLPNAMSVEEIQDRLQLTYWTEHTPEFLMSLRKNTLLDILPDNVIHIMAEYTPQRICTPCPVKRIKRKDLDKPRMFTNNLKYQGIDQSDWSQYRYTEYVVKRTIHDLICSYLPPYEYGKPGPQTKCAVFPCCAITGEGLHEGLDWLSNTLNEKHTKKNNCILM